MLANEMGYANPFQSGILLPMDTSTALSAPLRSQIVEEFPSDMDELTSALGE
jgi:hypothetical protein